MLGSYRLTFALLLPLLLCSSSASNQKIGRGYHLISIEETTDGGLLGYLQVKQRNNIYGPDISLLQLYVKHETEDRLRVRITDAQNQRWEVPYNLLPREKPPKPSQRSSVKKKNSITVLEFAGSELIFNFIANPFGFSVKRKSNGQTLFNSSSDESNPFNEMVFKDQYLEISTKLPENASIYGLGENSQPHGIKLYPNDPYTLYTTDVSAVVLNTDLYGAHPVYMDLRNVNGEAFSHAVLLLNSNGMDVFYTGSSLTYKVIGGVFDFYFFAGPSPLDVVDQYTALIGRPAPMPYWAFGFHQCRWGYHNLSVVEDIVENYQKAKIPLDVIWNDGDHMDGFKDFTLDIVNFPHPKLLIFLDKIHEIGMHYIVIIDPGISVNESYGVYQRGKADDVFIKYEGEPYLAQLWPGAVNFPDFLNPKTVEWWADEIRRFHKLVPVDGLWIDMNEASNLCSGKCTIPEGNVCQSGIDPVWSCCLDCKNITNTKFDEPSYKINASGSHVPVGFKTIAMSSTHYNGVLEYDAHSLYGLSEAIATHKALENVQGKRPFILTRSTFVGSGKYAAHWTGDNKATWENLKYSISTMLNFGIFGLPMVGSDICGFYPGDPATKEELCNRWIELGAFYPFSRNHVNYNAPSQELYLWESVSNSARNALGMRYKLLPYLYTLSYEAHTSGAPIARPVFFSFPSYTETYRLSTQFLLGKSVMISPVLDQGKSVVNAFFPPGSWYNLFDMSQAIVSKGEYFTLDAPLNTINVHLFQNTILPMQQGGMVTKQARMTPYSLIIAFPAGGTDTEAIGSLFIDDDELPEMKLGNGYSSYVNFYAKFSRGTVKVGSNVEEGKFAIGKGWIIENVTVLGLVGSADAATLEIDGKPVVAGIGGVELRSFEQKQVNDSSDKVIGFVMAVLNIPIGKNFEVSWKMTTKL